VRTHYPYTAFVITPALLRAWGACWTDQRIVAAFGCRLEVSPRAVAVTLADVSLDDRLWVLCRAIVHMAERGARMFAIARESLESLVTVNHLIVLTGGNDLKMAEDLPLGIARHVARQVALQAAIERALHWLGDYADGWEE
jgi:hypothetical protein